MVKIRFASAMTSVIACSAFLAAATNTVTVTSPLPSQTAPGQCNNGPAKCCNSNNLLAASNILVAPVLALLGITVDPINALVGLTCTNIVGSTCSNTAVCCQNNTFNGLINIGCVAI